MLQIRPGNTLPHQSSSKLYIGGQWLSATNKNLGFPSREKQQNHRLFEAQIHGVLQISYTHITQHPGKKLTTNQVQWQSR